MSTTRDLLIEVGTEELPPKTLENLSIAFANGIRNGLQQQQLAHADITVFATPRRLAMLVKEVMITQPHHETERRGPALTSAFNSEGQPTPAALGFARACGVDITQLSRLETDKGSWLVHRSLQPGQATAALLPNIIETALANLPIPKRMRWSDLPFEFVRPVHWLVILFGEEVVPAQLFGITSGRDTRGHRFHHSEPMTLNTANAYVVTLEKTGYVIPEFGVRRERIRELVKQTATTLNGEAVIEEALLNEVTSLVEWPVAVSGTFAEKFLEVPAEALIATMKNNQKCFHLVDRQGKLLPKFIAVSNIASKCPEMVRTGNERVIRPRLSDAAFFWQQDCAKSLESRLEPLKTVVFQEKLGNLYDRAKRVAKMCGAIAKQLGEEELQGIRAAQLAKCDLMTQMVGEFPELQGIMGEYYARHDGETRKVATALREHYLPRFAGDVLPATTLGRALAIADRLDTLVGIFGIGQAPTGDRDPFGLRRAAIGVLRIMVECALPLNLKQLLVSAQTVYPRAVLQEDTSTQVFDFMLERLRGYYQDQNVNLDSIEAVLACRPSAPLDIDQRIRSVEAFRNQPAAASLATANKRIHNILKKAERDSLIDTYQLATAAPDPTYFNDTAERKLYDQMEKVSEQIKPLVARGDYRSALQELATLRDAVDIFFEKVLVIDPDITVRNNRLVFLQALRNLFLQIADISRLQI
ncbi:MAG: glycine--tRNA ligase subunit beta [Beggiatoa sp. IS2]|nr:MAG: glycine--tRNA ligase subunit beta [Beggiatoa sp. IS2]